MKENIWYFEDVDFYDVFCPHKVAKFDAAQSHCFINFNKGDFDYQKNDQDKKVYLVKEGKVKIGHNTEDGKEITIMRGTFRSQDEFQKILKQLAEMNLHYQKVTVYTLEDNQQNSLANRSDRLSSHTWIHELPR